MRDRERSMTIEDWRKLAALCMDEGAQCASQREHDYANEWYALASKCAEREAALRAGRVMP